MLARLVCAASALLAACSLSFDASKIAADGGRAGEAGGGAGGASVGGSAGSNGLPRTLGLWRFEGSGQPARLRDRGDAQLGIDLYAVLGAEFGRASVQGGVLVTDGAAFRSDPPPGTAAVAAIEAARAFSAEAWAQIERTNDGKGLIVGTSVFRLQQTAIGTDFGIELAGANTPHDTTSLRPPTQRRHVVAVFSEATGIARLYIDGDEAVQRDYRPEDAGTPTIRFPTGESRVQLGSESWRGRMELVAIYDRALEPAEVRALFAAGPGR